MIKYNFLIYNLIVLHFVLVEKMHFQHLLLFILYFYLQFQYLLNNCLLLFVILVIAYYILKFLISPASSFGSLLFNSFLDVSLLSILFYLVAFQPKERFFLIQVVKGLISNKTNKS